MSNTHTADDYRPASVDPGGFLPAPQAVGPPLIALPVDETSGDYVTDYGADEVGTPPGLDSTAELHADTVPLIGAVTLGGDIVGAATIAVPANSWITVGELGRSRPSALELWLIAAAVGLEIQGIGYSQSSAAGFPIPSTRELVLHARAANIHNTTGAAVNVSYMLVTLGTR